MKFIMAASFLLTTSMVWANPLLLKCTINKQMVTLNVEGLTGRGCYNGQFELLNGQLKSRYNVTLCRSTEAQGYIEVQNNRGEWISVDEFSTDDNTKNHCYLWRDIVTTRPCNRHSHDCHQ